MKGTSGRPGRLLAVLLCATAIGPSLSSSRAQEPPAELTWSFEGLRHFELGAGGCAPTVVLNGLGFAVGTAGAGWSASGCGLPDVGLVAAIRSGAGAWSIVNQSDFSCAVPNCLALHGGAAFTVAPDGHPFNVFAAPTHSENYAIYVQDMLTGVSTGRTTLAHYQNSMSYPNISASIAPGTSTPTFAYAARSAAGGPLGVGFPVGETIIAANLGAWSVDSAGIHVVTYTNHPQGVGVYYSPSAPGDLRQVIRTTQNGGVSIAADEAGVYIASAGTRPGNGIDDTRLVVLSSANGHAWEQTEVDVSDTRNPSIAVDGFGNVAIAYFRNGRELRLARRVDGAWQHTLVAALPLGHGDITPHLAFDMDGRPHILYYDTGTRTIMLARGEAAVLARTLTVSMVGAGIGDVSSSPAGIACGTACQASYAPGQRVLLEANAHSGSAFIGWGGACTGTGPCLVTMHAASSVVATFVTTRSPIEVSPPGSGGCTLAAAIAAANADAEVAGCTAGSGADVIHLPAGTYSLTTVDNSTHGLLTGLPIITSDITIVGDGPQTTIIERAAGAAAFRLMRVFFTAGSRLTLDGVTMRGGDGEGNGGGAIYTNNSTVIRNSVFENNSAGSNVGGAIRSSADLSIATSLFRNNQAPASDGGAIYSTGTQAAPLSITTSKFENNSAIWGGAVSYSASAPHASAGLIANSIFHRNTARHGGGAVIASAMTMFRLTVTSNRVTAPGSGGGGLFVSGTTILDSTISDNTVSGDGTGGGVLNSGGTLTIQNSTLARNVANSGGGASLSGIVTVRNVTFSDNRAVTYGAGLVQGGGRLTLQNATIVGNEAGTVAGGFASAGFAMISLQNSIVALNTAPVSHVNCQSWGYPIVSTGHNLIGNLSDCPYTPGPGDLVGTNVQPIDPLLGPLQDNGGATFTRLPPLHSPVIDAGSPLSADAPTACTQADQRGVERPQRVACDIGAVERANTAPVADALALTLDEDTSAALTLTAADAEGDPITFVIVEQPSHGVLSGAVPNLTYTPSADFNGADAFSFVGTDTFGEVGAPATVAVEVKPVNDPITAVNDVATLKGGDGPQGIDVLANDDASPDVGETLTVIAVTSAAHGVTTIAPDGTHVMFAPSPNYAGGDAFTYTASDGHGSVATANVVVTITAPRVITIEVAEQVGVSDQPVLRRSAMFTVLEEIGVADEPALLPSVMLVVSEAVAVADTPSVEPLMPAIVAVIETVSVSDTIEAMPSALVAVHESISVLDSPAVDAEPINTPAGSGAIVVPVDAATSAAPVRITFPVVTKGGNTTLIIQSSGPAVPSGFLSGTPAVYFDVKTTAEFAGEATLCIDHSKSAFPADADLHLFHYDRGLWLDETSSKGAAASTICATVSSFSPFAVFAKVPVSIAGRMTGNGEVLDAEDRHHRYEFRIAERTIGDERGKLKYTLKTAKRGKQKPTIDTFESTSIAQITFSDDPAFRPGRRGRAPSADAAMFAGTGRWNGTAGYTFEARATDQGEPGRGRDVFAITIRDRSGAVVATVDGVLAHGNNQSLRLKELKK